MTCPDCKGTRKYKGLRFIDPCPTCCIKWPSVWLYKGMPVYQTHREYLGLKKGKDPNTLEQFLFSEHFPFGVVEGQSIVITPEDLDDPMNFEFKADLTKAFDYFWPDWRTTP